MGLTMVSKRLRARMRSVATYHVKKSIFLFVEESLGQSTGLVLDVGCGHQPYRDFVLSSPARRYVGIDFPTGKYGAPCLAWDGRSLPVASDRADTVLLTEVLEHTGDATAVLTEVARVLRPGGRVLITVPFVWPLHDMPHDEYRYTPTSLKRIVTEAGLDLERLESLGGIDAAAVQTLALWAARRPMPGVARAIALCLVLPLVLLVGRRPDLHAVQEESLPTGFRVVASKSG